MTEFPKEPSFADDESKVGTESKNEESANIVEVDLSVLLDFEQAQGEDEPDLIVELIDLYLGDFPQQLATIKDSVSKADEVSLKRAVHTIKGSSANLGVNSIARLCEEFEQTDVNRSSEEINGWIDRLEQSFARVSSVFLAEREKRV